MKPKGHRRGCPCVICSKLREKRKAKEVAREANPGPLIIYSSKRLEKVEGQLEELESRSRWVRGFGRVNLGIAIGNVAMWCLIANAEHMRLGLLIAALCSYVVFRRMKERRLELDGEIEGLQKKHHLLLDRIIDLDEKK